MPFSSIVKAGNFVYISGHTGTRNTYGNPLTNIQDQRAHLKKMEDFGGINEVYKTFYVENFPARSTLVTDLVADRILLEIELVLYKE